MTNPLARSAPRALLRAAAAAATLLGVAAGCASSRAGDAKDRPAADPLSAEAGTRTERVRYDDGGAGSGYDLTLNSRGYVSDDVVGVAPDLAWSALVAAYTELGLTLEAVDPRERTIGSAEVRVRGKFAGRRASSFLDCGDAALGPNADHYMVLLRARSAIAPAPGETSRLRSAVTAVAGGGGVGGTIRCTSTGALEREIAKTTARGAAR